jgi:hypothetical protein
MGVINPMLQPNESEWSDYRGEIQDGGRPNGSNTFWILVAVLTAAAGIAAFFGYTALKKQNIQLSQLFGSQATVRTLGQRVDVAESKLRELSGGWEGVGQRMTNLEAKVDGNLRQTRKYAETLTQQLHQQISAELDARSSALDDRLRQVESEQTAQRSQMAQVEAGLKQDIDEKVGSVREETSRDLSGVRQQAEANSVDVSALSQRLDRKKVHFELTKGVTEELVPGISLQIDGTNSTHQRYRGSLLLLQDHRTSWLRDQSVDEPVQFFHEEGGEPYELVVTDVTKKAAVGYLLVPGNQNAVDKALPGQGNH